MTCLDLADDEMKEILIMDWSRGCEMNKQERNEVAEMVSEKLSPFAEDLQSIHRKLDALAQAPTTGASPGKSPVTLRLLNSSWSKTIITVLLSAVVTWRIAAWQINDSHGIADRKRDISLEVSAQLEPIRRELESQGKDIAKIKGADHIAQTKPELPQPHGNLRKFTKMDQFEFARNITVIPALISDIQTRGVIEPISTVDDLQWKLASQSSSYKESLPSG